MAEQYDDPGLNEAQEASEGGQPLLDGALGTVIVVSVALVLLLASALGILYLWAESDGVLLGGPPAALLAWEDEYRELTGMNDVGNLDGSGVVMCVVDSGVDLGHPDLDHIVLLGWRDAVNQAAEPYDDEGHGTAMAGIIVADGSFDGGAKGVGLLVAKAIDEDGVGSDQYVSESVDWCVEEGADIISLSLGGDQGVGSGFFTTDSLEQSVEDALDNGVFVIAAAGNDGQDDDGDVESPGSVEDVICVGGITRDGGIWTGSSKGDNNGRLWPNPILPREDPDMKPEVVAPGHEVPVLMATGVGNEAWWGWSSGTSAATAWMSGAIALLLEHDIDLQRENSQGRTAIQNVKSLIMENSQMKGGQSEHDDHYGYGHLRVDLLIGSTGEPEAGVTEDNPRAGDGLMYAASFHSESVLNKATSVPPVSSAKPKA
ncbi:MAG: S8 family serine peptidase [Candidatus Thalassarchaeaceae archaeon]|nr:S8 family serine peptidase [Candidatus Thalassarchaeaceae archaeon]MDP6703575.1 S8 family serine peptidase [Candidatus Thalassarchaeaceae archaeon]